jgi:hypothetical protein
MRPTLYYEIKASREFPMRSELTRLVRCTRDDASEGVGKWLIEILDFPMDGILDTTFVHDTPLANRQIGRTVCGKVICALSLGSRIQWSAEYRQITMEEALDLLDLIKV